MALRTLMLRKKITDAKAKLEELRTKESEYQKREAELETAIEEANTEEAQAVVDEAVTQLEADMAELKDAKSALEEEVAKLEEELAAIEEEAPKVEAPVVERKKETKMEIRERFKNMTMEQRSAIVDRDEVKTFLERVRNLSAQTRSVKGADLAIPETILPLIRHEVAEASKLLPFVNLVNVSGTSRQPVMGAIPEAVWTEMCGKLNELDIVFNAVDVDGYKVAGFVPICNALLEDSDIALADEIISALGGAIAKALDKAMLFGTGVKMPLGIVTRLAQTSQPESWGDNMPAWTDLHSTNVLTLNINSTRGTEFFEALVGALGVAKPYYNSNGLFWVMNRKTHMAIMAKALAFNAAGALVAGIDNMPVVGGTIIEFEDSEISDNEIIGGFGGNYLLAQRAGATFAQSKEVLFLDDQTVFKGTARYDGCPVAGEAFVIVNYNNTSPTTTKSFPEDYANADMNALTVTAANGAASGDTVLTVGNTIADAGAVLKYAAKKTLAGLGLKVGDKLGTGWTSLTSGTTQITAAAGVNIVVVELDGNNRVVSAGEAVSVPKA